MISRFSDEGKALKIFK